jgi:serine/threonine-protein kinase
MIEPCTPPLRLTRVQYIDATGDRQAALRRCVAAIRGGAVAAPAARAPSVASSDPPAAQALAPATLAQAEQRLTPLVGPIAAVLVRRAAARTASPADFYADLASRLPGKGDSERFLASVWDAAVSPPAAAGPAPAAPEAAAIAPEVLAALTQALIHHLGPIAATLVTREKATAGSTAELRDRLSLRIAGPRERAAFLKETARL